MPDLDPVARVKLLDHIGERTEVSVPAASLMPAGTPAYFDDDGCADIGAADDADTARVYGLTVNGVMAANQTVQVVHRGKVMLYDPLGANVLDELDYGDIVYLSDTPGLLSDAPGTIEIEFGMVVPFWSSNPPEKALELDIAYISPAPVPGP